MEIQKFDFTKAENQTCTIERTACCGGISTYTIRMRWGEKAIPAATLLKFDFSAKDTYSVWDCRRADRAKRWSGCVRASRLGSDMPVIQMISRTGRNRSLFALSDVKTPLSMKLTFNASLMHEIMEISFFTDIIDPIDEYTCELRIDERDIPFNSALDGVMDWYGELGYPGARIPEQAKAPVYSTWYSYLTRVTQEDVIRECRAAKDLGMDTVIVDDGWQREDGQTIYGLTGDWEPYPPKFPDMRKLADDLHAIGMKFVLWFSVPFVGHFSKNFKRFEGKYLYDLDNIDCAVLDPRYKENRDFIISTYVNAAKNWKLDGFKLDFIDRFKATGEFREGMDTVSVEEAVHVLLKDIYAALTAIDPEMMIEFRQPYCGPVVSAYGNMMRVWDCPNDGFTNRASTIDLRLSCRSVVHSDMIRWSPDDAPECVAAQLIGTMFSVPQISVRFDELTEEQARILKNYLNFWTAHRDTLLDGALTLQSPDSMYSYAEARKDGEKIAFCVSQSYADVSDCPNCYLFNLSERESLILRCKAGQKITVSDCAGCTVREFEASGGLMEVQVPLSGMIYCKA